MRPNKWMVSICFIFISLLLFAFMPLVSSSAEAEDAVEAAPKLLYIKQDARLLTSARRSAKPFCVLETGTPVDVIKMHGPWALVQIGNIQGFLQKDALSYSDPISTSRVFASKALYVHAAPKLASGIIGAIDAGYEVQVLEQVDSWSFVQFNGKQGYAPNKWLTRHDQDTEMPTPAAVGDKGEHVKTLQQRLQELGYLHGSVDGSYMDLTKLSIEEFQKAALLPETGEADEETMDTLFLANAPFNEQNAGPLKPATGKVVMVDWWKSGINGIFARGDTAIVTDVRTGISFRIWRGGGTNHADVQPYTASDTANMRRAVGGSWSWARRPIWVSVDGVRYAASMNCMNHGQGSIKNNNFDGHFCVHFQNSRTHGGNRKCPVHQACVQEAYNTGNTRYERELALKQEQQEALKKLRQDRKRTTIGITSSVDRNRSSALGSLGLQSRAFEEPLSLFPEGSDPSDSDLIVLPPASLSNKP